MLQPKAQITGPNHVPYGPRVEVVCFSANRQWLLVAIYRILGIDWVYVYFNRATQTSLSKTIPEMCFFDEKIMKNPGLKDLFISM